MESIGTKLLDFSQPFDVSLLDQVVNAMNDPSNSQRGVANQIMVALQEHKESWHKVCDILEQSSNPHTKFFGLQILEDAVKYRWKILPVDQREGIKSYIVNKLMQMSQDDDTLKKERTFVHKLDLVLVQVLKHEWPHNWPSFVSEIVESSKTGETLCENNLFILKLLSEEVFDYSKEQMTMMKAKNLKESVNSEFTPIFQLCEFVLEKSTKASLVTICLQTLLRFISWIPLGYIFETNLVPLIASKFFAVPAFRNDALSCLAEIATLKDTPDSYRSVLSDMFTAVLTQLESIVPVGVSYEQAVEHDEVFVQRLALFLTGFFKVHLDILQAPINMMGDVAHQTLTAGFTHLVNISKVDDDGIFKICLDYWHLFTKELYSAEASSYISNQFPLQLGNNTKNNTSRKMMFANILTQVRLVMISQMVKPSEVLIVEDENGDIVRETTKDTEALSQYKTMHEALVYLTHLDYEDTENIMLEKLAMQVDGKEWSWNNLNTLCWAVGSISGSMNEEDEKRFLVTVIKDLLGLCEMKRGKDNKAVVASNIMYVVGQYPRFLKNHWKFLKTVVNKLFEFMHELHPGVQDMACDTFLKISQKCRFKFIAKQAGESEPFVDSLLTQLPSIVSDLESHQVLAFYESVGSMLSAEPGKDRAQHFLTQLMQIPNSTWKGIMTAAVSNFDVLVEPTTIKEINKILKTNVAVCNAVGPNFQSQMGALFADLLNVYNAYSSQIELRIQNGGAIATKTVEVRAMRSVKRETLKLIRSFVECSNDSYMVTKQFLPVMLEPILQNYSKSIPNARDSEVLTLMASCIDTLKDSMAPYIIGILGNTFECTLGMITKNFEDYPEHRMNFFKLLKAVNDHCFESLFSIAPEQQKLVVDSIVWAFKHTERNIADTGLETLYALLINVQRNNAIAQGFYGSFFLSLLQDIFAVLTDRLHKSGFKMHSTILKHMFTLVEGGHVTTPLWESLGTSMPAGTTNSQFLRDHVSTMIGTSFPNLSSSQVTNFVQGCFDMTKDLPAFKNHLRDVLVHMKEFAEENNDDLFREERSNQSEMERQQLMASRLAVPGLVSQLEQDELDDL